MKLDGIHHITAITGDAPRNVDFYARVMGLRMVKKTVNQDDPTVYHLFYADEHGQPGARPHLLRVPRRRSRAAPARAWSTASSGASASPRRSTSGPSGWRRGHRDRARGRAPALRRSRGPRARAAVADVPDEPLIAEHPEVPAEHRASGLRRRCAPTAAAPSAAAGYSRRRWRSSADGEGWEVRGDRARRHLRLRPAAGRARHPGRGHRPPRRLGLHDEDHEAWRERVLAGGGPPTPRDRPPLLPLDLLPRAERRAVRARRRRPGLHGRRAAGDARRTPVLPP